MIIVKSIEDLRKEVRASKMQGNRIALVPTMGALHSGHLSLVRLAKENAEVVVVSIFVNPAQFGPNEDFETYPRTADADIQKCEQEGVDIVFMPTTEIMYGSTARYFSIEIEKLNKYLDGGSRKGFFEGIALVVNKLFNIVEADIAVFGQKDYQQFRILEEMVKEFNHGITLIMAPIAREPDGLAMSSRNAYLNHQERNLAPILYQSLQEVVQEIKNGLLEPKLLLAGKQARLEEKGFKNDYLGVYELDTLWPVEILEQGKEYLIAVAVYLGKTRLIDNIIFGI